MTTSHTPGPWALSATDRRYVREVNGKRYVASCTDSQHYRTYEEAEANARLIAAAPDMLAALEALTSVCENEGFPHLGRILPAARAAIARATGQA